MRGSAGASRGGEGRACEGTTRGSRAMRRTRKRGTTRRTGAASSGSPVRAASFADGSGSGTASGSARANCCRAGADGSAGGSLLRWPSLAARGRALGGRSGGDLLGRCRSRGKAGGSERSDSTAGTAAARPPVPAHQRGPAPVLAELRRLRPLLPPPWVPLRRLSPGPALLHARRRCLFRGCRGHGVRNHREAPACSRPVPPRRPAAVGGGAGAAVRPVGRVRRARLPAPGRPRQAQDRAIA